jgi:RNA polymerase sigma factor (sigma-70 family)
LTSDPEATTAAAVGGDLAAVGRLYEALAPKVRGYFTLRGVDDPEGLTNEVFIRLIPLLPQLQGGWQGLRTLTFSIAHARVVDEHRRRASRPPRREYEPDEDPRTSPDAETEALARVSHEELLGVLDLIPSHQRSVIILRVVGDLSIKQTATAMGMSGAAVKKLQSKGLETLRRLLTASHDRQISVLGGLQ